MRRRFGRGRRGGRSSGGSRNAPIDAAGTFGKIIETNLVGARALNPVESDGIPDSFAAIGSGESDDGKSLIVAFAPENGGDAALAGLAYAQTLDGFDGEVVAVCPQWTVAARRRLSVLGQTPYAFRALAASSLIDGAHPVEVERVEPGGIWIPAARVGDRLVEPRDRELFARGLAALEGLAAKHGGVVRGVGSCVEFVLLAQRVALIRVADDGLTLETLQPEKSRERLEVGQLATALDRLEGQLRKRLNDRRLRSSDEGMRSQLWSSVTAAEQLRSPLAWPMGGADDEVLDFAGIASDGVPVVGAVRSRISLKTLGAILDAATELQPSLPLLLAAEPPVRLDALRLVLAASEFEAAAVSVLPLLAIEHRTYDIVARRGRDPEVALRSAGAAVASPVPVQDVSRAPAAMPPGPVEHEDASDATDETDAAAEVDRPRSGRRRRGRGRRGPREAREAREAEPSVAAADTDGDADVEDRGFDEISLFDLDDGSGDEPAPRRSRRGRGRRRGRTRSSGTGELDDDSGEAAEAPELEVRTERAEGAGSRRGGRNRSRGAARAKSRDDSDSGDSEIEFDEDDDADDDADDATLPIVADIDEPDLDEPPVYEDDREDPSTVEATPDEDSTTPDSDMRHPRRRAAIVAHADRGSVIAAILLARDLRLLEGFWIYPQSELMTFFRSVATDLRENTPIYIVGFTASPARDTIQAASLYAGRIAWFDHHDWPPEDLENLGEVIGAQNLTVTSGNENPISAVLAERTRRSRFSDKIVELASGRFSQHDFERWGRLWWERLASIASRSGERRAEVDALLIGRPSDLAREVSKLPTPAPPDEVAYIAARDFRIVHFGGYRMVVVPVAAPYDIHLASRVARERYGAELSLSFVEGEELLVFSGDEGRARRNLDMISMASHLEGKHDWIEKLPSEDYVARVRVQDLATHPDRLDEVITQIAMGRSILEG